MYPEAEIMKTKVFALIALALPAFAQTGIKPVPKI